MRPFPSVAISEPTADLADPRSASRVVRACALHAGPHRGHSRRGARRVARMCSGASSSCSLPTPSRSPRCSWSGAARRRGATSRTAIVRPACSACWPAASRSSPASSSSSPSRATTSRARVGSPRRSRSSSSSRPRRTCPPRRARAWRASSSVTGGRSCTRSGRDGAWQGRRHVQPVDDRAVQDAAARRPEDRQRAGRVRQVAGSEHGSPVGAAGPDPWRGGHHAGHDLDRAVPDRGR